jgi:hypothetical protein
MAIEVFDQPSQQNPRDGRSLKVAVRGHDALDVDNQVLNQSLHLAGNCIDCHQRVALLGAVLVAQDDNRIQLLLQLGRKSGPRVAGGHEQGEAVQKKRLHVSNMQRATYCCGWMTKAQAAIGAQCVGIPRHCRIRISMSSNSHSYHQERAAVDGAQFYNFYCRS